MQVHGDAFLFRGGFAILLLAGSLYPQANDRTANGFTPDQVEERIKQLEKQCVSSVRALNVAQITFWGGDDQKGFARKLSQLGPRGDSLINQALATGLRDGYRFRLIIPPDLANETLLRHYAIVAQPSKRLSERQRSYYTDETGVIRFTELDHEPTRSDPPFEPPQDR